MAHIPLVASNSGEDREMFLELTPRPTWLIRYLHIAVCPLIILFIKHV